MRSFSVELGGVELPEAVEDVGGVELLVLVVHAPDHHRAVLPVQVRVSKGTVLVARGQKMDAEMPLWKQPFWYWVKWLRAWPFSIEALSGLFDFNHAPFFQSFVEVRVERSKKRVVLILNGVDGPLHWRDLQIGGASFPAGSSLSDQVEFIVPMDR